MNSHTINSEKANGITNNAGRSSPHPSEAHQKAVEPRAEAALLALQNAITHESTMNYGAIFEGFAEKGVNADDILPRQNVFTFNAWRALGRTVRRGEHGVKVVTWIPCTKKNKETGDDERYMRATTTTVFHISQTEELPVKNIEQSETVEA